eukprot:jgi/Bigna1/85014/estExt_fgenesh1_pg.C_10606
MEEGRANQAESSGLMSYQKSQEQKSGSRSVRSAVPKGFFATYKYSLMAAMGVVVFVACCSMKGSAETAGLTAAMYDDIPPPPADPNAPPPPPADPSVPPPPPPAPDAPPPPPPTGPAPPGPPPLTACQTGMVADADEVPDTDNEMKACYLICDNADGATPCDVDTCKSACWFGNDFCYNSCVGGCQFQAVGLNNGSRMACDGQVCYSGCSYQCQKQCNCGVQKDGHCHKEPTNCMLDESIPGSLIGATVNYICSKGPSEVRALCGKKAKLSAGCQTGFGFAVALASYYYSYTMSNVPQTTPGGISAVASACDFNGFGFIKHGAQHPCQMNYKGYAGKLQ